MKSAFKNISFLLCAACAIVPAFAQTSRFHKKSLPIHSSWKIMNSIIRKTCALTLLLLANALPAWAQTQNVAAIANYEGSDRQQRLVAEAKREGSLTIYTSITPANFDVLKVDFEKKYGVKVNVWRAGDDKVVQRVLTEAKANRNTVDLVHVNAIQMEELHRERMLQQVKSPYINDLVPSAVPAHREWIATFMNLVVMAYNTDKVKKEELPKTYQDLLDPKWKGRLGVEANDEEWFYAVVKEMGQEKGIKYFRDLVATNGLSVRTGHSLLNSMVISGDVPLALTVFGHMPMLAKQKGAHIDSFMLEPTVAFSFAVGLLKKSPNPNAAILFYEFMITEGQKHLSQMNYVPTNKDTDSPFKKIPYKVMDKALFLNEYEKWQNLYQDIILKAK